MTTAHCSCDLCVTSLQIPSIRRSPSVVSTQAAGLVSQCNLCLQVHIISAACENMISGKVGSLHPGDILTSASGKTVEVCSHSPDVLVWNFDRILI